MAVFEPLLSLIVDRFTDVPRLVAAAPVANFAAETEASGGTIVCNALPSR